MSTIAAISTAQGNGGIGIVRVSGKDTFNILEKIFKPKQKSTPKGYTIKYGYIVNEKGEMVDEVLVSYFIAPKSYTTEDMCEINSHGNNVVLRRILELCLENGAKLAEPGEFTKRAFLNGRIDLSQAEAVIDLINSKSINEQKVSISQLSGGLSNTIHKIKEEILDELSDIEASIDYPEYDIEEKNRRKLREKVEIIEKELIKLEHSFTNGKIIRDGIKVAIVGSPNAGKSTLLNALLNEERSIVTNVEGTTRDTIEEFVTIQGVAFKIIDTAGIREAKDIVEKIGIKRSLDAINSADLVIMIIDSSKKISYKEEEILNKIKDKKIIIALNKCDLKGQKQDFSTLKKYTNNILEISAINKEGLEELSNKMIEIFNLNEIITDSSEMITNIRHKNIISESIKILKEIINTIDKEIPIDMCAIYLRDLIEKMNEITGENVTEDIINKIFSKFCLGK